MDLTPTEEQRLLRESAERFVADRYHFAERQRIAASPEGMSRAMWREFAELGWLGLPLPDAEGGLGGGAVETGILMEAFGRGLVLEPWLPTVLLGGGLVAALGTPAQRRDALPRVADGTLLLALAHGEGRRSSLAEGTTTARRDGKAWIIEGRKTAILGGAVADAFLVSARIAGSPGERRGIGLFLVPRDAVATGLRSFETLDGGRAADLALERVSVGADALLGDSDDAADALEAAIDRALAALASEAVGAMQVLLDATVAYTKTRVQFGHPLAANQALRHRMSDMAIACEEARSLALLAALRADAEPALRARAASGAKAKIGKAARFVAEQAVQLHGGMGVTEELEIGAYLKRILAIEIAFGSTAHHLRRYASLAAAARQAA